MIPPFSSSINSRAEVSFLLFRSKSSNKSESLSSVESALLSKGESDWSSLESSDEHEFEVADVSPLSSFLGGFLGF